MKHAKRVVVVFDDAIRCQSMEQELGRLGLPVQAIMQGPSVFRTALESIEPAIEIILLVCERAHLALVVANVRSTLPYSGIVVLSQLESEPQRTELLLAGADNLLPAHASATELAAIKHALSRRAERFLSITVDQATDTAEHAVASFNADSPWILLDKGWSIMAPSGAVLELTYGEKQLLELFSYSADGRVSREDFLQIKSSGMQSKRAVDSLISRLKRKAAQQNVDLPIRSVHGWGYSFAGRICKEERADEHMSASEEQALLLQQIEQAWRDQGNVEGRLSLQFLSRIQLDSAVQQGVEVVLCWDGTQHITETVLEKLNSVIAIGLLEHAIYSLCVDMREWQQVYKLSTSVQLSLPESLLPELQPVLLRLLPAFASEARYLALVLSHAAEHSDIAWITLCAPLRALGVSIWLEHSISEPEQRILSLDVLHGLRFCYPESELSDHTQQVLKQACAKATEYGLQTIVGNVSNKAKRDAAVRVGATYVQGDFLGGPMSRDGVLLGLASIESM